MRDFWSALCYNKGTKGKEVKKMKYTLDMFINFQLNCAKTSPDKAELFMHNAYGALYWEICRTNDQDLIDDWELKYKPAFEAIQREC